MNKLRIWAKKYFVYVAWIQAIIATMGSLYFSEVMKFTPCKLCWYQRILMYPLVFIIATGIFRNDKKVFTYVLPLSILGTLIAFYHNIIYYQNVLKNSGCPIDQTCTSKYITWFGFVSIPLLSLTAFTVITACMLIYAKLQKAV